MSDHGENLGARRLWGKSNMYEESAAIPMILSGLDVPRGKRCHTPVSQVDIYPTVLDAVGATPDAEDRSLPGTSLLAIASQPDQTERLVLSQYHAAGAISGAYMLRRGCFKYIYYVGCPPELYDLDADPEELDNLAMLPAHARTLSEFEKLLRGQLDPEAVDQMAKADQQQLIERYGGRDVVLERGGLHGTPAPSLNK
jgi:choline-sulfatase